MKTIFSCFLIILSTLSLGQGSNQKNIVFILCDDLNRSGLGSIYNTEILTPHIDSLVSTGIAFTNAHSNAPLCGPSRASLLSGIAPTTSGHYGYRMGQNDWRENAVLQNSTSVFRHFKDNGYQSYAVGKLYHKKRRIASDFTEYDQRSKRGPYAYGNQTHTDLPEEFNSSGMSFAALENIPSTPEYTGWVNRDGTPFIVESSEERDLLSDELSVEYAEEIFLNSQTEEDPFFLTLGFRLPHHPMHIPQSYFDLYNIEDIDLDHLNDSVISSVAAVNNRHNSGSNSGNFRLLIENVPEGESDPAYWLKRYIQAYYASVSFLDDMVGQVCDALRENGLEGDTYIVLTSDHGYHLGSKKLMAKTTLWNDASGVPIIISGPEISNQIVNSPVSLVDVYPTLVDLAELSDPESHNLDGVSLLDLAQEGNENSTLVSVAPNQFIELNTPGEEMNQHHALVQGDFKYILYSSGEDELYNVVMDEHEVLDLSLDEDFQDKRKRFHKRLSARIDNAKAPEENFSRLYYGDFEQKLNGWRPSVGNNKFVVTMPNDFFSTQHLTLAQPTNSSLDNNNININDTGQYTLKIDGYLENSVAELECILSTDTENFVDTIINISQGPQNIQINFQIDELPLEIGSQKLALRLLSGNNLHIDNVRIINEALFSESLSNCVGAPEISIDLPPGQIPVQSFSEALFEPNPNCDEPSIPARSYWGSFNPTSEVGVLFALTTAGAKPTMEVFENCTDPSIRCGSFSNKRALLLLDELDTSISYITRVTSSKISGQSMPLKIGFINVYPAQVLPSTSDLTPSSDLEVSPFSFLNRVIDSVHFEFISPSQAYTYSLNYQSTNEYGMELFTDLPFGTYNVKVSHELKSPKLRFPYGATVQVTFAPEGTFLNSTHNNAFSAYPNPVRLGETVTFNLFEQSVYSTATIRDISGRVIRDIRVGTQSKVLFNINEQWSAGIYIVELSNERGNRESFLLRVL